MEQRDSFATLAEKRIDCVGSGSCLSCASGAQDGASTPARGHVRCAVAGHPAGLHRRGQAARAHRARRAHWCACPLGFRLLGLESTAFEALKLSVPLSVPLAHLRSETTTDSQSPLREGFRHGRLCFRPATADDHSVGRPRRRARHGMSFNFI